MVSDAIDKRKPYLGLSRATSRVQLITTVCQAERLRLGKSIAHCPVNDERAFFERETTCVTFECRAKDLVVRSLPSVPAAVVQPESISRLLEQCAIERGRRRRNWRRSGVRYRRRC